MTPEGYSEFSKKIPLETRTAFEASGSAMLSSHQFLVLTGKC
jgi:hypothetical protein